jgi:hypothetical protein
MDANQRPSQAEKTLRLIALTVLEGRAQKEQIRLLNRAGFGQAEIANLLDSTPKAISVRLAELRKLSRNGRRSK